MGLEQGMDRNGQSPFEMMRPFVEAIVFIDLLIHISSAEEDGS